MSNVIAFLESMGQHAEMRHAGRSQLYLALNEQEVDADAKWAILRGDGERLAALLRAPANICCPLNPGKENDEDEPSRDDDEITTQPAIRAVAA